MGPYRAVRRVELSAASQSRNPERVEVSDGQRKLKCRAIRQPPRFVSAARCLCSEIFARFPGPQFSESHRSPLSLLPDHRPRPAPGPLLKTLQHRRCLTLAEITNPAAKITAQFLGHLLHFHASPPSRQFPDLPFEPDHCFRRKSPFWFPVRRETETRKLPPRAALFCSFTFSLSRVVMDRFTLSITRSPARRLRTYPSR